MITYYGVVHWSVPTQQLARLTLNQVSPLHNALGDARAEQSKYSGTSSAWDVVEWCGERGWRRLHRADPETGECPT